MSYATPAYWQAQANACKQYADEGACLSRIARRAPGGVTIVPGFGLGQTASQVADATSLIGGLFTNPEATLRARGPAIVSALDSYVVGPVVQAAVERSTPYMVRYFGPPLVAMYIMTALSTWFSYEVLLMARQGRLKPNRGGRGRSRRRR